MERTVAEDIMETILLLFEEPKRGHRVGARKPGLSFQADPYTPPQKDFMQALGEIERRYPLRKLRKGEKGAAQQLRDRRDHH
jgi:hypothetical protein